MNAAPTTTDVSLISSYRSDDLRKVVEDCKGPLGQKHVELYVFMQSDLKHIFPEIQSADNGRTNSVLKVLAEAADLEGEDKRVARYLHTTVDGLQIVAFATFLPEIAAHEQNGNHDHRDAQKALCFLVKVARILNATYHHPIRVIELVAGSLVDGIWKAKNKENIETFVVNRKPNSSSLERLWDRLLPVSIEAAKEPKIYLACELEPGPLFSIRDLRSLEELCTKLDHSKANPSMNEVVGLNLDIAHWAFLSEISIANIRAKQSIVNRIVHAHISDHSRGHFCDASPKSHNDENAFMQWLKFLNEIGGLQSGQLRYNGWISLELECVHNLQTVSSSLHSIRQWIGK